MQQYAGIIRILCLSVNLSIKRTDLLTLRHLCYLNSAYNCVKFCWPSLWIEDSFVSHFHVQHGLTDWWAESRPGRIHLTCCLFSRWDREQLYQQETLPKEPNAPTDNQLREPGGFCFVERSEEAWGWDGRGCCREVEAAAAAQHFSHLPVAGPIPLGLQQKLPLAAAQLLMADAGGWILFHIIVSGV